VKRILITGRNSYVGRSFMQHAKGRFVTDGLSVRDEKWKQHDFRPYDAVIHVAAIVHQPKQIDRNLYFRVNRDLAGAVAQHAITQGVKQFIFISTMAVYGLSPSRSGNGCINRPTLCHPVSPYGESKLAAENALREMEQWHPFTLSIIRPPIIYGPGCSGNYFKRLLWMGHNLPIFPAVRRNRLSMIGIKNLCELLCLVVENEAPGVFCPQDPDVFSTEERLQIIAKAHGRKIRISRLLGFPFCWLPLGQIDSLYGDLYYNQSEFNHFANSYARTSFTTTITKIFIENMG
jgi:nucleoside-diphosphate-sugar epimerase